MKFLAIPHKDMPATLNLPKSGKASRVSLIEGWNTKDLKPLAKTKKKGLIKYNPSISLLKKNKRSCEYIMWYRATQPANTDGKRPKTPRGPPYNSTMWDSDWNLRWDGAGICIVTVFDDGRIEVKNDMIPATETSHVLDARLVFWRNNFHVIYNRYTKYKPFPKSNPELEGCPTYGGGLCITMETHPIRITSKGVYSLGEPRLMCRDKHTRFEKNWSIVIPVEKKRLLHYSFTPQMKFLESDHADNKENSDECTWKIAPNSDFFMKLFVYYKDVLPPLVANGIAVTTPLIDFDKKRWIGIGRVKIDYKKMDLSKGSLRNSKLGKFMNLLRIVLGIPNIEPKDWFKYSPAIHASLLYFSFFYTVNKKTLSIDRFSPAYLPQCPQVSYFSSITFPVAIQPFTTGHFAVSLGIADIDCGIITISKKELENLLIYSNRTKPDNFDFQIQSFENPLPPFQN